MNITILGYQSTVHPSPRPGWLAGWLLVQSYMIAQNVDWWTEKPLPANQELTVPTCAPDMKLCVAQLPTRE